MLTAYLSFSQDTIRNDVVLSKNYAEFPEFKDGIKGLLEFIEANLVYPQSAIDDTIEGRVLIGFLVDTLGNTSDHKVLKGVRGDIDNEALRIVRLIKFDKPAYNWKNEPIEIEFMLPISFILQPEKTRKWWEFWRTKR